MNLLLANDDGYEAEGINVLARILSRRHDVYIVAPSGNRSASSHCISMHNGVSLKKISDKVWACSGQPADCVFTGLETEVLPVKIDCVIAGINHGGNIGTDIVYSGTCGAAREASLLGYAAVAVSLEFNKGKLEGFEKLADFVLNNLEKFVELCNKNQCKAFININGLGSTEYKGAVFTDILSRREYDDDMKLTPDEEGFQCSNREGQLINKIEKGSDEDLVKNGFISVSLVQSQPETINVVEGISFSL